MPALRPIPRVFPSLPYLSLASLTFPPWQSGSIDHEQGVSKAGNPRLRTTMVELAWLWLQNQPASALSLWFNERVRRLGGRMRKTTVVALARKLLIALWRYTPPAASSRGP
jgi:transposase